MMSTLYHHCAIIRLHMGGMCADALEMTGCINNVGHLEDFVFFVHIATTEQQVFIPIIGGQGNLQLIVGSSLEQLPENWAWFRAALSKAMNLKQAQSRLPIGIRT
jgi:hypothetical protein